MAAKNSYFCIYIIMAVFVSTAAEESVIEIKIIYISKHLKPPGGFHRGYHLNKKSCFLKYQTDRYVREFLENNLRTRNGARKI